MTDDLDGLVKPIEWTEWPQGRQWKGRTPIGTLTITHDPETKGVYWLEGRILRKRFDALEAAQSEAHADYTRRILSALTPDAIDALRRAPDVGEDRGICGLCMGSGYGVADQLCPACDGDGADHRALAQDKAEGE